MPRARSGAFLLLVLTAAVLTSDSPQATFCACGIQVGGTVATSDRGTIVIEFAGTPSPASSTGRPSRHGSGVGPCSSLACHGMPFQDPAFQWG